MRTATTRVVMGGLALSACCLVTGCRTVELRVKNENAPVLAKAEDAVAPAEPLERATMPGSFRPGDLDVPGTPIEEIVARLAGLGIGLRPEEGVLEIAGWVNLEEGPVEFLACTPDGPVERSLLVLDCVPSGLHAGLLALGLAPRPAADTHGAGDGESRAAVDIELRWQDLDGGTVGSDAAELLWLEGVGPAAGPVETGAWTFPGSGLTPAGAAGEVVYSADRAGRLVALRSDGRSVLGRGATKDRFVVHPAQSPARGTRVTAIFTPAQAPD